MNEFLYFLSIMYVMYYFGLLNRLVNYLQLKYIKWLSLLDLVSTRHRNWIMIIFISIKLLLKSFYIYLCQLLNKTVVKISLDTYEVSYVIRGKLYKIIVKPRRGSDNILQIIDDNNDDVTNNVLSYHGPNRNWHGIEYTPGMLGYDSLTFLTLDCMEYSFSKNDVFTNL